MITGIGLAFLGFALGLTVWAFSVATTPPVRPLFLLTLSIIAGMLWVAGLGLIWLWFPYEFAKAHGQDHALPRPLRGRIQRGEEQNSKFSRWVRILDFAVLPVCAIVFVAFFVIAGFHHYEYARVPAHLSPRQVQFVSDILRQQAQIHKIVIRVQVFHDDYPRSVTFAGYVDQAFRNAGVVQVGPIADLPNELSAPRGLAVIGGPSDWSRLAVTEAFRELDVDASFSSIQDSNMDGSGYAIVTIRDGYF